MSVYGVKTEAQKTFCVTVLPECRMQFDGLIDRVLRAFSHMKINMYFLAG